MKKIIGLLVLLLSVFTLVACGGTNELDGEYYWVYEGKPKFLRFEIKGDEGYYYPDGSKTAMTIDKERNTFTYTSYGIVYELTYEYNEDGTLSYDGTFGGDVVYKKGSKAYNEELESTKE
ncbi:TPA: lipoprotein [Streptococcus suis]